MQKRTRILLSSLLIAVLLACLAAPAYAAAPQFKYAAAAHSAHCHHMCGNCFGAMELLSEISGKSVAEIKSAYPQKTAWQAAKAMGKLDELKKAYLSRARVMTDRLVADKRISAQDGAKMYEDIQKRVAAIDGVNTVIVGKPNFRPQFKQENH